MVQNTTKTVPELVASVATKGGCTEVGVSEMKALNSSNLFAEVIRKTAEKAHALGQEASGNAWPTTTICDSKTSAREDFIHLASSKDGCLVVKRSTLYIHNPSYKVC